MQQVLVVVVDDNGKSETLRLEKFKETRNFIRFQAGDMSSPIIGKAWVAKSLLTRKKS